MIGYYEKGTISRKSKFSRFVLPIAVCFTSPSYSIVEMHVLKVWQNMKNDSEKTASKHNFCVESLNSAYSPRCVQGMDNQTSTTRACLLYQLIENTVQG